MEYRDIGHTDLKLSVVTFGAWAAGGWMWGGTDRKEATEAIKTSYDLGVTSIDTAPVYGQGLSEEIVGEAIRDIPRDSVQILTKFGLRWDTTKGTHHGESIDNDGNVINTYIYAAKEDVIKECEDSLRRLNTDYIDLYQIHWPDSVTPVEETMEAVIRLQEQGKVREAGVCNYTRQQMIEAAKFIKLASNQVPYSMVRRNIEEELVPWCRNNNKAILAYSPLQRGLLTGKIEKNHTFRRGDSRAELTWFSEENIGRVNRFLKKIKPIADSKGATLAQLVIRWTTLQPGITIALAGARNPRQAEENAKAAELKLSSSELKLINDNIDALSLVGV